MSKSEAVKEALLSAILSDPWSKEHYVKLIEHLRNCRQEDELENFRTLYACRFLPDSTFWRSWFADIVQMRSEDEVHTFFLRSFDVCPDVDLACDYLAFIEKCVEDNEMVCSEKYVLVCTYAHLDNIGFCCDQEPVVFRRLLEPILSTAGTDLITGAEIWNRYRALEVEEFEDLIDASDNPRGANAVQAKEYLIRQVFTRQLSLPLLGNESALRELDAFLEEYCEQADEAMIQPVALQHAYEAAIQKRDKLMVYEDKILAIAESDEPKMALKFQLWKDYIQYELDQDDSVRAVRLYERAILAIGQNTNLRAFFEDYADFASAQKNWNLLDSITRRGTVVAYDNIMMWKLRLFAVELCGQDEDTFRAAHDMCLSSGLTSPGDYLTALLLKCDYYRRKILKIVSDSATDANVAELCVRKIRESFDYAENFLNQYYPSWVDGWASILRYRLSIEDYLIPELAEKFGEQEHNRDVISSFSPTVWEKFMTQFGRSCGVDLWKEYLQWTQVLSRDISICRRVLRKGIALTASDPAAQELLYLESVKFEDRNATSAEDVIISMLKVKPKLQLILKTRVDSNVEQNIKDYIKLDIKATDGVNVPETYLKRPRDAAEVLDGQATKKTRNNDHTTSANFKGVNSTNPAVILLDSREPEDLYKSIFIKNVSFSATEDEILELFQSCGEIEKSDFLKSDSGKFKGMVHIFFTNAESAAISVTKFNGCSIHNRSLTVELFKSGPNATHINNSNGSHEVDQRWHPTTVFVSRLPAASTETDIKSYFEPFGSVKIARLLVDKNSGESKCRALVEFYEPESVSKALDSRHIIDGHTMYVTRSKFPAEVQNNAKPPQYKSLPASNLVESSSSRSHDSSNKGTMSTLGLKPRVLKRKVLDLPVQK